MACGGGGGGSSSPSTPPASTYSISGTVLTSANPGVPVSGVTVVLSGAASQTTTTNSSGTFSFSSVANGSYSVAVTAPANSSVLPASQTAVVNGANLTLAQNFIITTNVATYSLAGTVSGSGNSGLKITLAGANTGSTLTNSSGAFSFSGLVAGATTVTPTAASGFIVTPQTVSVNPSNPANPTNVNFVSTAIPTTFTVSGTVSGSVVAGVTVTLSQGATTLQTVTTNAQGAYSFATPVANGSYVVTPSYTATSFAPLSSGVTVSGANVTVPAFVASAASGSAYIISGTVLNASGGAVGVPVDVSLNTTPVTTVQSAANGSYTFPAAPGGVGYIVSGSLTGYTIASNTITTLSANTTVNLTATAAVTGITSNLSGTISYAGTAPGGIFIDIIDTACACNTPSQSTWIAAPGAFTIRGVPPGTYTLIAFKDAAASQSLNLIDPTGSISGTVVTKGVDVTGLNVTLTDPAPLTAAAPTAAPHVIASNNTASVFWSPNAAASPLTGIGGEAATAYKVYWGTDTNASNGTNSPATVPPRGKNSNGVYFVGGLTNGQTYYFKVSALGSSNESAASPVSTATVIGASTGANTVSGTVTMPPSYPVPGTLAVGFAPPGGLPYLVEVPVTTASATVAFSISGIPSGTYNPLALYTTSTRSSVGAAGIYLAGNASGYSAPVTISGNTSGVSIAFPATDARAEVSTEHGSAGTPGSDYYQIYFNAWRNNRIPVAVAVVSGINIVVPADLGGRINTPGQFSLPEYYGQYVAGTVPAVGDTYQLQFTYADGTTEIIPVSVTGVLNSFPGSLATSGTRTAPTFSWSAPSAPPQQYGYFINVYPTAGGSDWYYGAGVDAGMPSTQLSVAYDVDATAKLAALVTGTQYTWAVSVKDSTNHNQATLYTATPYVP